MMCGNSRSVRGATESPSDHLVVTGNPRCPPPTSQIDSIASKGRLVALKCGGAGFPRAIRAQRAQ